MPESGQYDAQNNITTSGTTSEPITIEADSQDSPVFISGVAHALDIVGASNIVISDFEVGGTIENNIGAGTYTCYDRGAVQRQDTVTFPSFP